MRGLFHMTNKMPPARYAEDIFYMPVVGVEPTLCHHQRILSFRDNPEPATL